MKVAVLSGKGGTGKTLLSVNLAAVSPRALYIDCDIEEPNGRLFFKPAFNKTEFVTVLVPEVKQTLCNGCRQCVDFCKFNALTYIKGKLVIFDSLCHSCNGCYTLCPKKALSPKKKRIGRIQRGVSRNVSVTTGILNVGEASGVPIIKKLIKSASASYALHIIDCPPGSSCIVMESIKEADYCILVAEPTIFGLHNLKMVDELVRLFNKPYGLILNKCMDPWDPIEAFCKERRINILGRIPLDQDISKLNSEGFILVRTKKAYKNFFSALLKTIQKEADNQTIIGA